MSVSKSLFEIGQDMQALDRLLDEAEGDITGQEEIVEEWFQEVEDNLAEKIDGYVYYCEELEARDEAIKEKRKHLQERRRVLQNRVDRLKDHLQYFFEARGMDSITGKERKAKLQNSGGKRPMEIMHDNAQLLPREVNGDELVEKQVSYRINKSVIREWAGDTTGYVVLLMDERGHERAASGLTSEEIDMLKEDEELQVVVLARIDERGKHLRFY